VKDRLITLMLLSLALLSLASTARAARSEGAQTGDELQTTATVSGTITYGGSPVADVEMMLQWSTDDRTITTGTDGAYSVGGIPTGSWLYIYVYPPVSSGLAVRAWHTGSVDGDLTKDFDLVAGHRLQGEFRAPDGSPYSPGANDIRINPIGVRLPPGEFLPQPTRGGSTIDMVLTPGFYAIYDAIPHLYPYYTPPTVVDLTSSDVADQVITLSHRPAPHPKEPPVAALINVSPPDAEGYATVSGSPGSVPPLAAVMVLNQNAGNLAMTGSDASGAFSVDLYAPDGSWILVKVDPRGDTLVRLWSSRAFDSDKETALAGGDAVQDLPGATVRSGPLPAGGPGWQTFAQVGRMGWWGAWAMEGTLSAPTAQRLNVMPGDTLTVTADVTLHSPELQCTDVPTQTPFGVASLVPLFGHDGRPMPWGTWFTTHLFTPTGLPIEHDAPTDAELLTGYVYDTPVCLSDQTIGASLYLTVTLPTDLPEGIYRVTLAVLADIPADENTPSFPVWHHDHESASLPPIQVGDSAPPHIPWYLLLNEPVDGNRGIQAVEDEGRFALPTRVRTAPPLTIIPRIDARTGETIPYRLEPGTYWISGNDRRTPNPPHIPLHPPSGQLTVHVSKPGGGHETIGPASPLQTDIRTPSLADGSELDEGTGNMCDVYHLSTGEDAFAYTFEHDGFHTIELMGAVEDIYGNAYDIQSTYEVMVARILDVDPAQLPYTPYQQGDAFAPGLHVFPPVPAYVEITVRHLPNSNPAQEIIHTITGEANRFGTFQPAPGDAFRFESPGEFRVDVFATYNDPEGELWAGAVTWGGVVESLSPGMEAHGRRGLNFTDSSVLTDTLPWYVTAQLPEEKMGTEQWVPYHSGDIVWGAEPGAQIMEDQSLLGIVTVRDRDGTDGEIYEAIRTYYSRCTDPFAAPPLDHSSDGLEKRLDVGEAPLCVATSSGTDPEIDPSHVEYWGYWYAASERPDVHVREVIGQDGVDTAYWRFNDTYGYQIGEPADGDQTGDIKWNFGSAVMRVVSETNPLNEYAIYGSFWVLLPLDDPVGPRVTAPFRGAGALDGGPILTMTVEGVPTPIDMLFLPKAIRPGDVLEVGDAVAFSGHVGPPLDSRVDVTITAPSGAVRTGTWHANKIGWLYDPGFDFVVDEPGRWTVDVFVEHDRAYQPTGLNPAEDPYFSQFNTGTVMGTTGRYAFYVVEPGSPELHVSSPGPGFIVWPDDEIEPITIQGRAPIGTTAVHYTIHDKGIVMRQGSVTPGPGGVFALVYDAEALHQDFPMLSLTAREGRWEGLADEVSINLLAVGADTPRAATVTLIGEEVFIQSGEAPIVYPVYLPLVLRE